MRFLIICSLFFCTSAFAGIYKWTDENGKVHFSDKPPASKQKNQVKQLKASSGAARNKVAAAAKPPVTSPGTDFNSTKLQSKSQILQVRAMLYRGDYVRLKQRLTLLSQLRQQNPAAESDEVNAYRSFDVPTEQMAEHIRRWLASAPASYQPYLARAQYHYAKAWQARGSRWASETEDTQIKAMQNYLQKARTDIDVVLKRSTKIPYAFRLAYSIYLLSDNKLVAQQKIEQGVRLHPYSYSLGNIRMNFAKPRWGGSYQDMIAIVKEYEPAMPRHPSLLCLAAIPVVDVVDRAIRENRTSTAISVVNKALQDPQLQECPELHYSLGRALYKKEKYREAIPSLLTAISLNGEDAKFYDKLAYSYFRVKDYPKAADAIALATALKPADKTITQHKQDIAQHLAYEAAGDKDASQRQKNLRLIDLARDIAPGHYNVYYHRSDYFFNLGDYAAAEKELRKAIELKPDEFKLYQRIDYVIIKKNQDWNAITKLWLQYLELKPNDSQALLEIGGSYYHWGRMKDALHYLDKSAQLGNVEAKNFANTLASYR